MQKDIEGNPDDIEEDLSQLSPGPSKKRLAEEVAGEDDLFLTPKRPKTAAKVSPRRAVFSKVVKHNVKDKKQLNFDLKLARLLVANNCGFTGLASAETAKFCEEFLPQYHIKHPTTFTR